MTCDAVTGACHCKCDVAGDKCDTCTVGHAMFPDCHECNCNEQGSESFVCDVETGKCPCKSDLITGDKCDHSVPGYYDFPDPKGTPIPYAVFLAWRSLRLLQNVVVTRKDRLTKLAMTDPENAIAMPMSSVTSVTNARLNITDFQLVKIACAMLTDPLTILATTMENVLANLMSLVKNAINALMVSCRFRIATNVPLIITDFQVAKLANATNKDPNLPLAMMKENVLAKKMSLGTSAIIALKDLLDFRILKNVTATSKVPLITNAMT